MWYCRWWSGLDILKHLLRLLTLAEEGTIFLQNHLSNNTHISKDSYLQGITCNHIHCGLLQCDATVMYISTNVSEESTLSIFREEQIHPHDGGCMFCQKDRTYLPNNAVSWPTFKICLVIWWTTTCSTTNLIDMSAILQCCLNCKIYLTMNGIGIAHECDVHI